jgi:hypothetical protein
MELQIFINLAQFNSHLIITKPKVAFTDLRNDIVKNLFQLGESQNINSSLGEVSKFNSNGRTCTIILDGKQIKKINI